MKKTLLLWVLMLLSSVTGVALAQSSLRFTVSDAPTNGAWAENTHWYLINASIADEYHSKGYLCSQNTNYPSGTFFDSTYGLLLDNAQKPQTSYGLWCVVGDETNGYTFYNRGEGTSKVLGLKSGNFSLIDPSADDISDYVTKFDYAASTNSSAGEALCFKSHGTSDYWNNGNCTINQQMKSHLTTWTGNNSNTGTGGNAYTFTEADENALAVADYYDTRISEGIDNIISNNAAYVNYVFSRSQANLDAMADKQPTTKEAADAAKTAMVNAKNTPEVNQPVAGQKYLIKNKNYNNYLTVSSTGVPQCNATLTPDKLWTIEAGSTSGFYKLKNVVVKNNGSGKYIEGKPNRSSAYSTGTTGVEYKMIHPVTEAGTAISYNDITNANLGNYCFWHEDQPHNLVCWQAQSGSNVMAPSLWYFVAVDDSEINTYTDKNTEKYDLLNLSDAEYQSVMNTYLRSERNTSDVETLQTGMNEYFHKHYFRIISRSNFPISTTESGTKAKMLTSRNGMEADPNTLWQLHPVSGSTGYRLYNANGKAYVYNTSDAENASTRVTAPLTTTYDEGLTFTLSQTDNYLFLTDESGHKLNCEAASEGSILDWWNGVGNNNQWKIEPATNLTITLNAANNNTYATTYLPFSISSVTGAKAYVAQGINNGYVHVDETTNGVKAENGFLLIGESGNTTATLTIGESETTSQMTGTLTDLDMTNEDHNLYNVFGRKTGTTDGTTVVGFFTPSSSVTSIKANRGFFKGSGTQALMLQFNGESTGIDAATMGIHPSNAPIYDLSGRKVAKATKGGVYIQGGHKFIIK